MPDLAKPVNRVYFLLCVVATGAIAGAFVWLFFFLMDKGIGLIWSAVPQAACARIEAAFPDFTLGPVLPALYTLALCLVGGLLIGLFDKKTGARPEELTAVMAKVKAQGRYSYDGIGKLSIAALLPLVFGGSIGPEAGLTGVIAGLCTWVGDRMRRFGAEFRALTVVGTQAALTALFTAPLYGFVAPLAGTADVPRTATGDVELTLPKAQKTFVYLCAIVGALGTFLLLGDAFGGGSGLPRFTDIAVGAHEALLVIPLALAGTACGWAFHASSWASKHAASAIGERPVAKSLVAGLALGVCGIALPYTMFAGEAQIHELMGSYLAIPAGVLIATGFVKAALTPACINLGWRGGHFFPLIFAGVSVGYGFALLTGADAVACVAVCTAACMGAVMRQPLMAALLLVMCFPLRGVLVMIAAAAIGAAIPLPRAFAGELRGKGER